MPKQSDYVIYLLELLHDVGEVEAKSMFGGFGLYLDGLMFAIVADDLLYFKVDEVSKPEFEKLDLKPFVFEKNSRKGSMSYHAPPSSAIDNAEELCEWARKGHEAALRAARKKKPRKKRGSQQ